MASGNESSLDLELIERITDQVRTTLATVRPLSPAYAVALEVGDDEVYPVTVWVGLEEDRKQALSSSPAEIMFDVVFDAYGFPIMRELDEDPRSTPSPRAQTPACRCRSRLTAWAWRATCSPP